MLGFHHLNIRKRVYQKHEQYPHPDRFKNFIDKLVYLASILIPIMTLPQVYQVIIRHNAAGISEISWLAYTASNAVWLIYGVIHKEKPIVLVNSVMFALNLLIALGAIVY